jgi:Ca2+-binding RTX toxin-like protein
MRLNWVGTVLVSGIVISTVLLGTRPSYAAVGTVSSDGVVVTVLGTDSQDFITIDSSAMATRIEVSTTPEFAAGPGCALDDDPSTDLVICELESAGTVDVDAGAGNDLVEVRGDSSPNARIIVDGGPGDDGWRGGPAVEEWNGGSGDDMMTPDFALQNQGPDVVRGGDGRDQVNLGAYPGVSVTLDDQPNDTTRDLPFVDDIGSDVEVLVGTSGDDHLTGNDLPQVFDGGLGNDTIVALAGDDVVGGGGGDDRIDGGVGHDQLYGSEGNDSIVGGRGDDFLFGESGNDTLTGGPGGDTLNGDSDDPLVAGDDTLEALDGERDAVTCGPGNDKASVDTIDAVSAGGSTACEAVTVTPAPPPVQTTPPSPVPTTEPPSASTALVGKLLHTNRRVTRIKVPINCSEDSRRCSGRVAIRNRRGVLARGRYTVAAGDKEQVTVRLTHKGRTTMRHRASVRVVAVLTTSTSEVVTHKYRLKRG